MVDLDPPEPRQHGMMVVEAGTRGVPYLWDQVHRSFTEAHPATQLGRHQAAAYAQLGIKQT